MAALPQLIFGFLSVGVQPLHRFPEWIQPIVRNQPVSRLVDAMRSMAGDSAPGVPAELVGHLARTGGSRHCGGLRYGLLFTAGGHDGRTRRSRAPSTCQAARFRNLLSCPDLGCSSVGSSDRCAIRWFRRRSPASGGIPAHAEGGAGDRRSTAVMARICSVETVEALLAPMSGSTTGMVGLAAERRDGFLARL